jgi:hypothetical protein
MNRGGSNTDPSSDEGASTTVVVRKGSACIKVASKGGRAMLMAFERRVDGGIGPVEASGKVDLGDYLEAVNCEPAKDFLAAIEMVKRAPRPLTLTFFRPKVKKLRKLRLSPDPADARQSRERPSPMSAAFPGSASIRRKLSGIDEPSTLVAGRDDSASSSSDCGSVTSDQPDTPKGTRIRAKVKGTQLLAQNKALESAIVRGERELRLLVLEKERLVDTLRQQLRDLVESDDGDVAERRAACDMVDKKLDAHIAKLAKLPSPEDPLQPISTAGALTGARHHHLHHRNRQLRGAMAAVELRRLVVEAWLDLIVGKGSTVDMRALLMAQLDRRVLTSRDKSSTAGG